MPSADKAEYILYNRILLMYIQWQDIVKNVLALTLGAVLVIHVFTIHV